jgi:hypothetical protein
MEPWGEPTNSPPTAFERRGMGFGLLLESVLAAVHGGTVAFLTAEEENTKVN